MSTEAQDKAVLNELFAIRLYGVDLHIEEPKDLSKVPQDEQAQVIFAEGITTDRLATQAETEDAWRKLDEEKREHWRAIAQRLLPQLEDDGVTVRARAEAAKTLRIALTVPAHTAYEIPGLKK